MKQYSEKQVEELTSTDLRKVASELGIPNYAKYKKDDLLVEVIKVLEVKPSKKAPTKEELIKLEVESLKSKGTETLSEKEWNFVVGNPSSASEVIRDLWIGGFRKSVISKILEIRPQMVHNVINNYLKKQDAE